MNRYDVKVEFNKQIKKIVSLMFMVVMCTFSVFSLSTLNHKVNIYVDGKTVSTITINTDTDKILSQNNVNLLEGDYIVRNDNADGTVDIIVHRAFRVSIDYNGEIRNVTVTGGTVEDAISSSGIALGEKDKVNYDLSEPVVPDMNIVISQFVSIAASVDGKNENYLVPEGSVKNALEYLKVDISNDDVLNYDLGDNVFDGMNLVIKRVVYEQKTVTENIPFEKVYKKSDLLDKYNKQVVSNGKLGKKEVTYKTKIVDGVETEKEVLNSKVTLEPVNEIIVEGTRCVRENAKSEKSDEVVPTSQNSGKQCWVGVATAYTASSNARTSTGKVPKQGITIAVNPRIIPYGTKLEVCSQDGKKICNGIAQDTGGAMMKGHALIDIFMDRRSDCIVFGRRKVIVRERI